MGQIYRILKEKALDNIEIQDHIGLQCQEYQVYWQVTTTLLSKVWETEIDEQSHRTELKDTKKNGNCVLCDRKILSLVIGMHMIYLMCVQIQIHHLYTK